jgi:hypothetical protein
MTHPMSVQPRKRFSTAMPSIESWSRPAAAIVGAKYVKPMPARIQVCNGRVVAAIAMNISGNALNARRFSGERRHQNVRLALRAALKKRFIAVNLSITPTGLKVTNG